MVLRRYSGSIRAICTLLAQEVESDEGQTEANPDDDSGYYATPERIRFLLLLRGLFTRSVFIKLRWHWNVVLSLIHRFDRLNRNCSLYHHFFNRQHLLFDNFLDHRRWQVVEVAL